MEAPYSLSLPSFWFPLGAVRMSDFWWTGKNEQERREIRDNGEWRVPNSNNVYILNNAVKPGYTQYGL